MIGLQWCWQDSIKQSWDISHLLDSCGPHLRSETANNSTLRQHFPLFGSRWRNDLNLYLNPGLLKILFSLIPLHNCNFSLMVWWPKSWYGFIDWYLNPLLSCESISTTPRDCDSCVRALKLLSLNYVNVRGVWVVSWLSTLQMQQVWGAKCAQSSALLI